MNLKKNIKSLCELSEFAEEISKFITNGTIVLLKGPLGVGKTAFTRELLKVFANTKLVTSPTFTYFETYNCKKDNKPIMVYHFDLYRLNQEDEFYFIGADEIIENNPNSIFLIEWPELVEDKILEDFDSVLELLFVLEEDGSRTITVTDKSRKKE